MRFTDPTISPYREGGFFLGLDAEDREIGISTERHLITIAGARAGKGAALIVPNLERWKGSAVVIDVKGENAELTWKAREAMGQAVHVIDPFMISDERVRLRSFVNPLDLVDPSDKAAREMVRMIADGCVMRHKATDGEWYDGAVSILAGFMVHAVTSELAASAGWSNFYGVHRMLSLSGEAWDGLMDDMRENHACGGLAAAAAAMLVGTSDQGPSKSAREFLSGARRSIEPFASEAMREVMSETTFRLRDIKHTPTTVFLALPSDYIEDHGRFLRLFVRLTLSAMEKPIDGAQGLARRKAVPCLFLLDEFYSLGRMDVIVKGASRMPGYGVHLWPILQDLGQLIELYNLNGAGTFFGNSDAHIFFGNTDSLTLNHIAKSLGTVTVEETGAVPPISVAVPPNMVNVSIDPKDTRREDANAELRAAEQARYTNARASYDHAMRNVGKSRLPAEEIRELIGKKDGDEVARSMIVFGKGGDVFNLRLAPWWVNTREFRAHADKRNGEPDSLNIDASYMVAMRPLTMEQSKLPWSRRKPLMMTAAVAAEYTQAEKARELWSRALWSGGFALFALLVLIYTRSPFAFYWYGGLIVAAAVCMFAISDARKTEYTLYHLRRFQRVWGAKGYGERRLPVKVERPAPVQPAKQAAQPKHAASAKPEAAKPKADALGEAAAVVGDAEERARVRRARQVEKFRARAAYYSQD